MTDYKPQWRQMYSDVYPNNTAMRVECEPKLGMTRLTVVGDRGVEVCYVFGQEQAFQAAYALLKSLNTIGHAEMVNGVAAEAKSEL